ncbi:Crp/Fnr family transcriptional regulator [Tundrisphaera sp. TA3]|uniref:Crp/Fnr family transcriptional regulator n=1 Tax=Tundrisphaera sp. TA3 TaxID=3435775 RepID=UPI003EBBAB97
MPTPPHTDADPTRRMPFLDGIPDDLRAILARFIEEERVPAGTELMPQGQPNDRLWFVVEGTVAIERAAPGGRAETLASLPAPSVFGTTTFYRPEMPASATIRAETDLHLWTLDHAAQDRLRDDEPKAAEALATAIIRILSERFDLLDRRLAGLMAGPDPARNRPRPASELAAFRSRLFEEPGL